MHPKDVAKAYNQITHLWESPDFNLQSGIEQHKRAIAFTKNRGRALDVGCGCTGRFIDLLLDENFAPEGIDFSEKMITLAREKHPKVRFRQADICQLELSEKYEFITAWDSIWHVPLDSQKSVMTKLISSLNAGGVLIFSCGGLDNKAEDTDNYMGPELYYSSLGINGYLALFVELQATCRHLEYDQYPESHTYFIVQKD